MEWIALLNIVVPQAISFLKSQGQKTNPATGQPWTYPEILALAGAQLDVEDLKLLADMAQDMSEGAK
jgi:hypothetical protein